MRKLLLQSAIATLVAINIASSVMAENEINASITLEKSAQSISVAQGSSLKLAFRATASSTDFTSKNKLGELYETSEADKKAGCVQISNLNKDVKGGGLATITAGAFTADPDNALIATIALPDGSNKTQTIANKFTYKAVDGACGTDATKLTLTTIQAALNALGIGTGTTENNPKITNDNVALYYQLPSANLIDLQIDTNKANFNKTGKIGGQLSLIVTAAQQ